MLGFQSPFWLNHSLWIRSPRKADCKPSVDANPYKRAWACLVFINAWCFNKRAPSMLGFQSPFWLNHSLWIRSPRKADCEPSVDANPYKRALGHQCLVFNLLSGLTTACELGVQGRLIANLVLMLIPINGLLGINAWFQPFSPFWLNHSLWIRSPRKADCKPSVDANPYKRALGHKCLVFNLLSGLTTACE